MIRVTLIAVEILIGVGALAGSILLLAGVIATAADTGGAPAGAGSSRVWYRDSLFQGYLLPASVILLLVGLALLVAAGLLLGHSSTSRLVSLEAGVVLLGWAGTQLTLRGYRHPLQLVIVVLGLAVVLLSAAMRSPG